jgi:glycine hydroxymethyltransferase
MREIAEFMRRIAIDKEDPGSVKRDVTEMMKDFQKVHYCFDSKVGAYENLHFK